MKIAFYSFFIGISLLYGITLASPGCMDNSWYLEKAHDNKELHPVSCACPCKTLTFYQGLWCLDCGHAHMSHPQKIVPIGEKQRLVQRKRPLSLPGHAHSPKKALKTLLQSCIKPQIQYK